MDYELLKTFILLANLKNFTKTAEQLHVVQSTVTSRIKHLEHSLGESLFIRTNKNVVLSNAGEVFLPYAKQLLSIHESAISRLKSLELFKDSINIGVVHSIYDCHVEGMIIKYMQQNKNISVQVTIEHSEKLLQMLHEDKLDIAFTYFNMKSPKFISTPFFNDEIILVTSPQNYNSSYPITNDELRNLQLLSSSILTESFEEWFYSIFPRNYVYPLDINISSNVIPFLKAGIGYSFILEPAVTNALNDGSLVKVDLLESSAPTMDSYMLINKHKLNSIAVNQLLSNIMPTFSN
ncbi:LysR family transcriptional regulator [Clostridium sp. SHJSY1]|uniref:LysR family transcriptional regulator n=1 Tax=Clostridium sp. SHJSY1 TaxID=2942483 RepID=UPI002876F58F|nr:LysR family transcriptional regulator [Clostridium sp. SHJSY1]MDS0525401.1 LysR family transcriptional regulator [Clostridium sp. SHJSY1]